MPSDGYKLYAWLLTQIPSAAAEALHSQQDHPISQFVTFDKEKDTSIWNIHLLSTEACALFAPAIESIETISLHTGEISVVFKLPKTEIQFEDIIRQARQIASSCMEIQFRSAASFKQNGRYVIFPQEKLILQSLVNRWNSFCEEYPLCDPDALCMLERMYIFRHLSERLRWTPDFLFRWRSCGAPSCSGQITAASASRPRSAWVGQMSDFFRIQHTIIPLQRKRSTVFSGSFDYFKFVSCCPLQSFLRAFLDRCR